MSRIGNRVLTIPAGVEVNVEGNKITTKGPKGTLEFQFRNDCVNVEVEGTEVNVTQAFDTLTKERTSIIIAHRLSTIKNADLIVVMDKGKIIETGSHNELLDKKGFYYNLYNSQFN